MEHATSATSIGTLPQGMEAYPTGLGQRDVLWGEYGYDVTAALDLKRDVHGQVSLQRRSKSPRTEHSPGVRDHRREEMAIAVTNF